MRVRRVKNGLTVNAIGGTHVVSLCLNLSDSKRPGCLGFAIQREDHVEDERIWLRGSKTFKETDPGLGPGGQASSRQHPFQSFQWADYSAKPGYEYTFTVVPLYGTPTQLTEGDTVSVKVKTEVESGAEHSVWFNRGAIASQEYARRFQNKPPDEIPNNAAYNWLSRGLLEALVGFIDRATDATYGVYGAIYEFQWGDVLNALAAASGRGATVKIVYDAIQGGSGPVTKNEAAIAQAGITLLCKGRTSGKLMHNKFFVLTKDNQPIAVWTGSTNLTENGIFGHSNLGHVVEDDVVAQAYLNYWKELENDSPTASLKQWTGINNVAPPNPWDRDTVLAFSPRSNLSVLDWYATLAKVTHAPSLKQTPIFMTFAFGINKRFQQVYEQNDGILRMALLEKEGNGTGLAQGKIDVARIRQLPNVVMAIGNNITLNSFDRWLKEKRGLSHEVNIRYVHTKYMLVDPLGDQPMVVTGSANFSEASTNKNDENMLIIRNNTRVADIYLGEFMRLYSHYAFREAVKRAMDHGQDPNEWQPNYLMVNDQWQTDYYTPGNSRFLRREYFSGSS